MTRSSKLLFASSVLVAVGCNAPHPTEEHEVGGAEVNWLNDSAIQNAIIAQHTVYPYHFVADAAIVNELGEHDLNVLIEHFKSHPGKLNVRRGDAADELYQSRVSFVSERMIHAGVKLGPLEDGPPGGAGMATERVLTVLERSYAPQTAGGATQSGTPEPSRIGQARGTSQ